MILSVDPATSSGFAVWVDEGKTLVLVAYGRLEETDTLEVWDLLGRLVGGDMLGWKVLLEDQWIGPASNPGSVIDTSRRAQAWQSCCEIAGADVERITPSVWVPKMTNLDWRFYEVHHPPKAKSMKGTKYRILCEARDRWPDLTIVADESDAILIGEYWAEKHGLVVERCGARRWTTEETR